MILLKTRFAWIVLISLLLAPCVLSLDTEPESVHGFSPQPNAQNRLEIDPFQDSSREIAISENLLSRVIESDNARGEDRLAEVEKQDVISSEPDNDAVEESVLIASAEQIEPEEAKSTELADKNRELADLQPEVYRVRSGDSLWRVAKANEMSVADLAASNGLSRNDHLRVGQKLLIPPGKGCYHRVRSGESLWGICRKYRVKMQEVVAANGIDNSSVLRPGQNLFLPGARAKRRLSIQLEWPLNGRLTSGFGYRQHPMGGGRDFHGGIDIAAPKGTRIRAAADGVVSFVGFNGNLGKTVYIRHADKYKTIYGHASRILVNSGQEVRGGQTIALVGNTGRSTGPHLHFELRKAGRAVDPLPFLP